MGFLDAEITSGETGRLAQLCTCTYRGEAVASQWELSVCRCSGRRLLTVKVACVTVTVVFLVAG